MAIVRQNFHEECEGGINRQINMELYASYTYLSMAYYFERDDQKMPNVAKFLKKQSDDEREHAMKLMEYQNKRGGRILLKDIKKPDQDEWGNVVDVLESALALEKKVNQALLDLHALADGHGDKQFCDFLESHYLEEQVDSIKEFGDLISRAKKCGPGLGEFLFDKHAFDSEDEAPAN
ncbi:soma ferritin-like [Symsagittifera roscoffensis]|uniref:soma ferritin-like n=1 Tax=Symsagittifera roscoffensis TaxID=84072 RepID=UPI00307CA243